MALKITWVKRINEMCQSQLKLTTKLISPLVVSGDFWKYNFSESDLYQVCNPKGFWKSVVQAWSIYNYFEPQTLDEVLDQYVWFNSHIKVQGKLFCVKSYAQNGIGMI